VTVERVKSVTVPVDQRLVLHAVEQILREQALYRQISINPDTATVTTTITPGFGLLSTKMLVSLRAEADQTQVEVMTRSQWYILGDIFNMYYGYIHQFLQALTTVVSPFSFWITGGQEVEPRGPGASPMAPPKIRPRRQHISVANTSDGQPSI
jgi:hypothetical protein